ncbi:TIGR03086 family metal-binding protein [Streptomyces sp. NPDC006365]|uniref:TIGR03086 family metal-binding protein n=1 Tax=Streptomyces sp. NPDC006365 TaxID=3364744 RepID=UPI00369AB946
MDTNQAVNPRTYALGDLLATAAERALPVIRALPDERLADPTPCADYDVKSLVNHLLHVTVQFQNLAAKKDSDFTETPDYIAADPAWRDRFATEASRLAAAWSAPGAEEGTTGTMNMPARTVASLALLDLTVHAWDLARATDQEYRLNDTTDPVLDQVTATVEEMAPTARAMGMFATPVEVPDTASPLDRLLAETGRDPHWARAGR